MGKPTQTPIARALEQALLSRRLSVYELADQSGLPAITIYRLLDGRVTRPTMKVLRTLEDTLGPTYHGKLIALPKPPAPGSRRRTRTSVRA